MSFSRTLSIRAFVWVSQLPRRIEGGRPRQPFRFIWVRHSRRVSFPRSGNCVLGEFEKARFFSTRRLDPRYSVVDALVKRLGYRDEIKTHEVVDTGRPLPAISQLEKDFRKTTQMERYLTPSVALYRELVKSGWNVNTLGEDYENALVSAIVAGDSASVAFLLQHGATVSQAAFEFAVHSKTVDVFRLLAAAKRIDYRSAEGGRLLFSAVGTGSIEIKLAESANVA
jgi:hypothetical protein